MGKLRRALPSPAMVIALIALAVSLSGTALAANGGNFILGKANTATAQTGLTANRAGKAVQITNTSTGAGATPLGLTSAATTPPFTTNSATKVTNLNADLLDGTDASGFYASGSTVFDSSRLGGHTFAEVTSFAAPKVILNTSFRGIHQNFSAPFTVATADGAPNMRILATVNASAYSAAVSTNVGVCLVVKRSDLQPFTTAACARSSVNQVNSHTTLVSLPAVLTLSPGSYTATLTTSGSALTNNDDYYSVTLLAVS